MSKINKIVLPTDFSDASLSALEWVSSLSDNNKLEVHCVNVVQEPMMFMPMASAAGPVGIPGIDELKRISADSLNSFTEQHFGKLKGSLIKEVLAGRPAEEIANYAASVNADLIVIATHGQSGVARLLLGSTTEGVIRQASCPVLTVRG